MTSSFWEADAAVAARGRNKSVLVVGNRWQDSPLARAERVDNYLGLPGLSGAEMLAAMRRHAEQAGVEFLAGKVLNAVQMPDAWYVSVGPDMYNARAVVLAAGVARGKKFAGEAELLGRGVSYCATCDGAFFRNQTVAVIGGGNVAVEDAILLSRTCKKVYVIHRRDELRADKILQEKLFACENVEIIWDTVPLAIEGENKVTALKIQNKKTGEEQQISLEGVFVAVGIVPNTELVQGLVKVDEGGYISAGEDCAASVPGIFAAGDIRTKQLRQVVTAVADGANAVISAERFL